MKRKEHPDDVHLADIGAPAKVCLAPSFNSRKFKLLEVSNDVIQAVENGESLRLVGDPNHGDVVLCTESRTFEVKRVETTNAVCLVPPAPKDRSAAFYVETIKNDFFEVKATAPRVEKLKALLKPSEYCGASNEAGVPADSLFTRPRLEETVQASIRELDDALKKLGAINCNGFIRLVSNEAMNDLYKQLFNSIIECGWRLDCLSMTDCLSQLPGTDAVMMKKALSALTVDGEDSADDIWGLDERKVAIVAADLILRQHLKNGRRRVPAEDFLLEWGAQTPGPSGAGDLSLLQGIALKDGQNYLYLPRQDLASDPTSRFVELFATLPKWRIEDLRPYLSDLFGGAGQPRTVDELLLQHTRMVDAYYIPK